MIYSKLPIVFLSTLASEKSDSINSIIASYILEHIDEMKNIGIKELASSCNVANSSISRFCKSIGLQDFIELKELLITTNLQFENISDAEDAKKRVYDYGEKIKNSVDMVINSIDIQKIKLLCKDILKYKNIYIFGLLKAETAAFNLQSDLLMLGKQSITNLSYNQQLNYIKNAGKDDLIIIFSYTGSYFNYENISSIPKTIYNPKIYLITGKPKHYDDYIDEVILFKSLQDQSSHPYQLQCVGSIIAQEYAYMIKKKS